DVGGVKEIVNNKNGVLLSANPSICEITKAIEEFIKNPELILRKGVNSRKTWQHMLNADRNFDDFASVVFSFLQ
ncbi:MAG: hypothetical protein P9M03_13220, partial [Candidatus Theseobacter exili]|nr:hypothetical protein [Candidatus Theseobacter exili]